MGVSREEVIAALLQTGVVAVVRVDQPRDLIGLVRALADGGVRLVEITMTVPSALEVIERAASELGADALIGAGTVLDATTARSAITAGAAFVVSPSLDRDVITTAHLYGKAVIPGCLTPSEIQQALRAGADVVKLFPGRVATPGYFADLKGPFPQARLMPTGNVDLRTTPEYIRAGAVAVGVGKALVDPQALEAANWPLISKRARAFRKAVDGARVGS